MASNVSSTDVSISVGVDTSKVESGVNNAKRAVSSLAKSCESATKKVSSAFSKMKSPLNGLSGSFKKLTSSLTRVIKMFKLMVTRMALRKVIESIGEGFKGLALYSSEFNDSMSLLVNSSKQLGYSFSAMLAPLINALAPALNNLIQMCVKAVNAINQLFSALSGKTSYISAKTQTDSWADSIQDATGKAKKLKNTLLGFDEINKLDDNSDSSSSALDPTKMFEDAPIESTIKDFVDKLKKAFQNADFSELGGIIGKKLKDALDKIPWTEIKETAGKVGKALATLINGFVETDGLGFSIGRTLAEALNTAIEFLYEFVTNLHWESIGKFIADTINGFFATVDFAKASKTLSEAVKGILTTTISILEETDWVLVGEKIGVFLVNIDWVGILNKVGQVLGSAFVSAVKFAFGFAKGSVTTEINKYSQEFGGNTVIAILKFIVEKFKALATPVFWSVNVGKGIGENLGKAIREQFDKNFETKIKPFFDKSKWTFSGVKDGLKATFQQAVDGIKSIWNTWVNKINGTFTIGSKTFNIHLPTFATGGFPEDGLFMANHGEMVGKFSNGKTAVANNEQITTGIANAVYQAMMMAGNTNNNSSYINNTIMVDSEVIARAVTKGQNSINRRYSPSMA